jgi:CBS domain-containing protein
MAQLTSLRDYMLDKPVKVQAQDNIFDAMQVIIDNKISGVCVVDEKQALVGILSELDCLRAALGTLYNGGGSALVKDYMASDNLVVANPNEDIVDVAQDMLMKNKRRRPVVENGVLVGQITCRQLLKAIKRFNA